MRLRVVKKVLRAEREDGDPRARRRTYYRAVRRWQRWENAQAADFFQGRLGRWDYRRRAG